MPSVDSDRTPLPISNVHPIRDIGFSEAVEPVTGGWSSGRPIAIDFGTSMTRCGYAGEESPSHVFPPLSVKHRDRRANRMYLLCGNDVYVDQSARLQARTLFDGPLISHWEIAENILDYCFAKLSVASEGGVDNPVVMSEIPGVSNSQRKSMNELLFEGYNIPKVAYGVDSLFSFYYNRPNSQNGLVISSGNEATHIIPVIHGKGLLSVAKRINWGGRQSATYLQNLLSLKYPIFPTKLSATQSTFLVQDHCYVSKNYSEELGNFLKWDGLETRERIVEAPFTPTVVQEKSQEELDALAERRKESGRRLQEQAAKKRLEKLMQRENDLLYYQNVQSKISATTKKDAKRILEREGMKDENMLQKTIKELEKAIKRARKQDIGDDDSEAEPPSFPLVEIPDEELDDEGIKEKRRQRLLKANYDARMRAKEEKNLERQLREEEEKKNAEYRKNDLAGWIKEKREKLATLLDDVKEKKRVKEELTNRKSMAAQQRMRNITALASDASGRKRKRPGNKDEDADDNFGADDDDWAVYRNISNVPDDEEDDEQKEISELQEELLLHDPNFTLEEVRDEQGDWRSSVVHMFLRGPHEFDGESQAQQHQMALNVERIRVPEVLFQPSIAGVDQAGIGEICGDMLLHQVDKSLLKDVASNIFATGGQALFENFDERINREIRSVLDVNIPVKVYRAHDPLSDAWRGMAKWSTTDEFNQMAVTKAEYEEMGSEYIKENRFGNS